MALADNVFLEQPQNVSIVELHDATFRCSVCNSSFTIFWLVNDYEADFTVFQERGVVILPINSTASQLHIAGTSINNHSRIQCVALFINNHTHRIVDIAESDVALLVVLGKYNNM